MTTVRPAEPRDLPLLAPIEDAADRVFEAVLGPLDWPPATAGAWRAQQPGFLLVAESGGGEVVGFAHVLHLEGTAHLEQLAVHPDHHRRGHGAALLRACEERARSEGFRELTLSTYADVPWNRPYYEQHGYEVVAHPTGLLARIQEKEEAAGYMTYGPRVVMRIALG